MTYLRHMRLTLSGTLGDGSDMFSFGLSMYPNQDRLTEWLLPSFITDDEADNMRADCISFWQDARNGIGSNAHLKRIKFAPIGTDGKYAAAPKEFGVDLAGPVGIGDLHPWQVSTAVTLETDADLTRVKGRIFLPVPRVGFDANTDLVPVGWSDDVTASVVSWINALANDPGIDFADWRVCVSSQGRHNSDGSQRLGPGNYDVQRVHTGRRLDVQRRRANKVGENVHNRSAVNQV